MSWTRMQSFSFIPLTASEEKIFEYFSKIYPLCCHGDQSNSAIWTKFTWIVEDYSRNISVKKKSKYLQWESKNCQIPLFPLSVNGNYVSIATRVLIWLEQKRHLFVPPAYRCYMWNLVRIGFMASEEMSFENVDRRQTISSPMSLRLKYLS